MKPVLFGSVHLRKLKQGVIVQEKTFARKLRLMGSPVVVVPAEPNAPAASYRDREGYKFQFLDLTSCAPGTRPPRTEVQSLILFADKSGYFRELDEIV